MRIYEDMCVNCPREMGCLGNSCPYKNVAVDYCDQCGSDNAKYILDGDELCEDCVKEELQGIFDDLSISEKAEVLDVDIDTID